MMRAAGRWWIVWAGVALAACRTSAAREMAPEATRATVDSIVPRDEALRRFREGVPQVDSLEGGKASREELLRAYVVALEKRDSAAVERLGVTKGEFAWLYYPTAAQGLPPYDVEPGLLWFLNQSRSGRASRRALEVYGGRARRMLDVECGAEPVREGENRIWGPCAVRWIDGGDTVLVRLAGQVLERGGRYKVLGYSNKL